MATNLTTRRSRAQAEEPSQETIVAEGLYLCDLERLMVRKAVWLNPLCDGCSPECDRYRSLRAFSHRLIFIAMPPPTMRELSRALGLSLATISRALRNEFTVAPDTRDRVQSLARELGYQLDANVSQAYARLRVKRALKSSPVLGVITSYLGEAEWRTNRYFVRFLEHINSRATELGYQIGVFSNKTPGISGQRLTSILRARGIVGLIIAPDLRAGSHLSLDLTHFASAACTHVVWRPNLHRVEPHSFQNTLLALRRLTRLGYRRIGLASFWASDKNTGHQNAAAYHHLAATGMIPEPVPVHVESRFGGEKFLAWLRTHRPDAILATHPEATFNALEQLELRPGSDIGLAGLRGVTGIGEWAGIDMHADKIDAAVVELVVDQINRNERGVPEHPRIVMVEGSWVDGPTVQDVRKRHGKRQPAHA